MAKILQGIGVEAISGTIGGTTFQKWRGLLIARGKPTPHNPQTERQMRIRSIVSAISRAWRDVLTAGQRTAWDQFAEVFPWFDVFGRSMSLRGISLFLKMNTVLLDHDKAMQITPPPAIEPPELSIVPTLPVAEYFELNITRLVEGIITAQEPFLDVAVAGGFTSFDFEPAGPELLIINSQCLPQGRKHQKSDFRHVAYADDIAEEIIPVAEKVVVQPPALWTRNVVIRIQRYNKYGRYSMPLLFDAISTGV